VLSVGYVIAALAAWTLLGETMSLSRWLGIVVIMSGVWLISRPA
jgi:drug/metabolite transporter (DMT)-like permease